MRGLRPAATLAFAVLAGGSLHAQSVSPPSVRLSINAGVQTGASGFSLTTTQTVYLEPGTVDTTYKPATSGLVDAGVTDQVFGPFGVGAAIAQTTDTTDASLTAAMPSPFFFNQPRTFDGTATGVKRTDVVLHMLGAYTIEAGPRVDVTLSAGPSVFFSHQDLVSSIAFSDTYPFETASFTGATLERASGHAAGYNAGADVAVRVSSRIGAGVLFRFARANVPFKLADGTSTTARAGGFQTSGGLRIYF